MTIKVLLLAVLLGLSAQQCLTGCLKCSAANACLICDVSSSYFLGNSTACALSTQTNCNILAQNGDCVQCNTNYYLDGNTKRCVAVTAASITDNCLLYSSSQACSGCRNLFALANGKCVALNVTIQNCLQHTAAGGCVACAQGYIPNFNYTACVAVASGENCQLRTFIKCNACRDGFILNPNLYFVGLAKVEFLSSFYYLNLNPASFTWGNVAQCQETIIKNCLAFSAFNFCTQCGAGYYLAAGDCIANPSPVIRNCLTYSNLITCTVCQVGYYLVANACLQNSVIDGCVTYNGAAAITTCSACNATTYLSSNACPARSLSLNITNCLTKDPANDLCSVCASGFILTTDKKACLALVANCANYQDSSVTSTALTCNICKDGYYLQTTGATVICVQGTVANCQTYEASANTCTKCLNSFYLKEDKSCAAHVSIPNCLTYHPSTANFCSVCSNNTYNFVYKDVCVSVPTVIDKCVTYNADGTNCLTCAADYYLATAISCLAIPATATNCLTYEGSACIKCKAGFMLNLLKDPSPCVAPLDYHIGTNTTCFLPTTVADGNTLVWKTDALTVTQVLPGCNVCGDYRVQIEPNAYLAVCVKQDQLTTLYSGFTEVSKCLRYGTNWANPPAIVCMQCQANWYLSNYVALSFKSTATECVETCALSETDSNAVIVDDLLGFVNICAPKVNAGFIQTDGKCTRYGRVNFEGKGTVNEIKDYDCLSVVQNSAANGNFLVYSFYGNAKATTKYLYESPTGASPVVEEVVAGAAYPQMIPSLANTLWAPVFNYLGILSTFHHTVTGGSATDPTIKVEALAVTDVKLKKNDLKNCDIVGVLKLLSKNTAVKSNSDNFVGLTITDAAHIFYFCARCNWGYQVSFKGGLAKADTPPLPSCESSSSACDTTKFYGGLPQHLNTFLSCHVCTLSNGNARYPYLNLETDKTTGNVVGFITEGAFSALVDSKTVVKVNNGFKCAASPGNVATDASGGTAAISTCAVYGSLTSVDSTDGSVGAVSAIACLACSPNYYPTYLAASGASTEYPSWLVKACTAVSNCDTSIQTTFNSCTKCKTSEEGLATPKYYAFLDLTLSNCVLTKTKNCLLTLTDTDGPAQDCTVCQAGYYLDTDKNCDQLRAPNQTPTSSFYESYAVKVGKAGLDGLLKKTARVQHLLNFKQLTYGASECNSGYTLAPRHSLSTRVCFWSSMASNNKIWGTTWARLANCLKYNFEPVDGKLGCSVCMPGYVPKYDNTGCVARTTQSNCEFVQSDPTTKCEECSVGYYNVAGSCVVGNINACATYVNTKVSKTETALTCSKCSDGFVLATDKKSCSLGKVRNCIQYTLNEPLKCSTCAANYALMVLNSVWYCYPIASSLQCSVLDQDILVGTETNYGRLSCTACTTGVSTLITKAFTVQPTVAQTICMPFTLITNCLYYNQANAQIKDNTYACQECASGFYYFAENYTCNARVNRPEQCASYHLTEDRCTACRPGYFLPADGKTCTIFPFGIINCMTYSSATNCTACSDGYYLLNNACPQSTAIQFCQAYSANYTCSRCQAGYFLQNATSCIAAIAQNCLTYTSVSACATCADNFGLSTTNNVTSCIDNLASLPNCQTATNSSAPFRCVLCKNGFFVENGTCIAVPNLITNCLYYGSRTTCLNCTANSVLSLNQTVCHSTEYSNQIDLNCKASNITANPTCSICANGFVFSNGICSLCPSNTYSTGCLYCSPDAGNACLICRPTFYMNSNGTCIAALTPIPSNNGTVPNNTGSGHVQAAGLALTFAAVYFEWL